MTRQYVVRKVGFPVHGVFSCSFLCEVYNLLLHPITLEQIAAITDSSIERVRLALNDLMSDGVEIKLLSGGVG